MIWLVGNKGMLGSDVEKLLQDASLEYFATDMDLDITNKNVINEFIKDKSIDWIINCAAYTAVDNAEDNKELAFAVNADAVKNLAEITKEKNAKIIHISTDYVFSGDKDGEYLESDDTNPQGVYGASKLKGEENIKDILDEFFILRTAWLYGVNGNNFVYTMIKLFNSRDELKVVEDQYGSPTFSIDLANVIVKIISDNSIKYGIYHFTNEGKTNWFAFANEILKKANQKEIFNKEVKIIPCNSDEFPTKAKRPKNSFLSKQKIKDNINIDIRKWQDALDDFLDIATTSKKFD
jgi:dTDP-4-dehydrorhamnose reductase